MTTLLELKAKAEKKGLEKEFIRLYGDLRKIETWERAIEAHQTVTVEAETVIEDETSYDPFDDIPFFPEVLKILSKNLADERGSGRQEDISGAVDCPPPPPPAPIIRTCPIPERQDIPGIEIAENPIKRSPIPGEGRGDERFKNLGDRLGEKIKADVFKYLDSIKKWIFDQYVNCAYLIQYDYLCSAYEIDKFQAIHKSEKIKFFEFIEQAIAVVTTIKQKHIPWYLHKDIPAPPVWCVTKKDDYFLLLERPGPIPTLSCDYGGEFIPNRYHELGIDIYCWKFPNQLRAEEFFEQIERATKYQFIPAHVPQNLLIGV